MIRKHNQTLVIMISADSRNCASTVYRRMCSDYRFAHWIDDPTEAHSIKNNYGWLAIAHLYEIRKRAETPRSYRETVFGKKYYRDWTRLRRENQVSEFDRRNIRTDMADFYTTDYTQFLKDHS